MEDEDLPLLPELIAPCGMNCAICSSYLAAKHHISRSRGKVTYCQGCRPRRKICAFLKKRCPDQLKLLRGEVEFCNECACFPCEALVRLDERYKKCYGMSMIENLTEISRKGMAAFLRDQYDRYQCPQCGNLRSVHSGKCYVCDTITHWKG